MVFNKPQVTIKQNYESKATTQEATLPSILIGPRYDVLEDKFLTNYSGEEVSVGYPDKSALSVIDKDYVKLMFEQAYYRYYTTSTHIWKKLGSYSNKIRTVLSDGIIFKSSDNYPHSSIFKDRGVEVNDRISITLNDTTLKTTVVGFEEDLSTSSIESVVNGTGNHASQSNLISSPVAGSDNEGDEVLTSNTTEDYAGDLYGNILSDVYTLTFLTDGEPPVSTITKSNVALPTLTLNDVFNSYVPDTYTITILSNDPVITYQITSLNNDNSGPFTFPASGASDALGSKDTEFTRTEAGTIAIGDTYTIEISPSEGRIKVETESGTDEQDSIVFPGFGFEFPICNRNVKIEVTSATSKVTAGDVFVITVEKELASVSATSAGTFTGPVDINYIVKVVKGGVWGSATVEILSTYTNTKRLVLVSGYGSGNAISLDDFGGSIYFATNVQGGLIYGDIFNIICNASENIGYKTLILKDSIFDDADETTIQAAEYTGAPGDHNTCTSSGSYLSTAEALHLYNEEIYTISISTLGAFGVAKFIVMSLSGKDNVTTPITIPTTPGELITVGANGLKLAFTGAEAFAIGQTWRVKVNKPSLTVSLDIPVTNKSISEYRENDPLIVAWEAGDDEITVKDDLAFLYSEWSETEPLYVIEGSILIDYRAFNPLNAETIYTISDESEIATYLGSSHIDNPIGHGALVAVCNSDGTNIRVIYPKTDDLAGYTSLLNKLEIRNYNEVFRIGVLSHDETIIDAVASHVSKMENRNKWRDMVVCLKLPTVFDIILPEGHTATIVQNKVSGKYNVMKTTNSDFSLAKVGDLIDYMGETYTISSINTSTELVFTPEASSGQATPASIYVYRNPTSDDLMNMHVYYAQKYANKNVVSLVPDEFVADGVTEPGYYLTAAICGLKNSLPPHQPITNYTLEYVDSVPKCLSYFSDSQLDTIANGGNMIITQDNATDKPYIRHQVTTDVSNIRKREWSKVEVYHYISYGILDIVKPFIGKYNIHPGVLNQLRTNLEGYLYQKTASVSSTAGGAILNYELTKLEQNATQEDKIDIAVRLYFSSPLNYMDIELTA